MIVALSDSTTITITVAGVVVALALLALLRIVFRREPSPPTWRRFRVGVFIERDPAAEAHTGKQDGEAS